MVIIGVGQIMLDLVVEVDDPGIYDRYSVEKNSQCLAEDKHTPLINGLLARADKGEGVKTSPGGVIANSLRGAAWWLRSKSQKDCPKPKLDMLGIVANDSAGKRLREELVASGVNSLLDTPQKEVGTDRSSRTGVCCCLIANKERTMITELGIGKTLHLDGKQAPTFPSWKSRLESLKASVDTNQPCVVLTGGFYIQADADGFEAMKAWCSEPYGNHTPILAVTVGAKWCSHLPSVQAAAKCADFLFANEDEILELATVICKDTGKEPIADGDHGAAMKVLAQWKPKGWIIGTRGSKSVCFLRAAADPSPVTSVPVPPLPKEEFVDDVGAGDSFMGGFMVSAWQRLAAIAASSNTSVTDDSKKRKREEPLVDQLEAKDLEAAVHAGTATAAQCLRSSGCQFPLDS
eukprot:TRINITY_DN2188_c1_g1_i2.p1 TRINITY_DN2188_c1_g1~~TRINITY_DN2188_c1_g1_i2.p1  ORF type:complete len:405 (-),score=73.88 TRINITY_DN2188_c1_g1_i2:80-1294(-)